MKKLFQSYWPIAAFSLSILLVGFNAIGIHYTLKELAPYWSATLRLVPSALIMFLLMAFMRVPFPRGKALLGAVLYGALNFGGFFAFVYFGLQKVQPGMSMVLLALVPLFTLLFSITQGLESFRIQALLGALVAAGGVALVFLQELQTSVPFIYLLAILLAAVCSAEAGVMAKKFPKSNPIATNAVGMSTGAVVVFLISVISGENLGLPTLPTTWLALAYLVLFGTCAIFLMFLYLLKKWPASRISYQFVFFPFVALAASAWLTHEPLSPVLLVGAAVVLLGVLIGVARLSKRRILMPARVPVPVPVRVEKKLK